ncbi:xanthine dehydrogenase accessory protein XdhC [Litoreibacter janthinus]|uniref:Molybdenum cofactor sulfurylase n=1 Tax=Litoreibacter janthinus TaxID=670154 RepID=A0A1I6GHE1_9RHOB|nr:xanthine dehydrogenase accessory protein XdhC [Litoreibacter janthinus]SFR41615.1 molybdenum cofactor sulfurylase [Litoreibacter janthinus]
MPEVTGVSFDIDTLREALTHHGRVARVVIVAHSGSSPRESGASMLVWDGGQSGTIGGGALELEAARRALKLNGPIVSRIPLGPALGQCCGGAVTLVTEVFEAAPDARNFYIRRIEGRAEQPLSIDRAVARMRNGSESGLVFDNGWLCESLKGQRAPLWVWGAGHVGRAIVTTLAPTDAFDITWVDSGAERFPKHTEAAPRIDELAAMNIPDAAKLAPTDAHHLILTYSHAIDLELCHRLLTNGFQSAGLIGSATKWARFRSRLNALGHTDAQISRIRCPIGQPALGKHPQAIAVGVASELLMTLQTGAQSGLLGKDVAV